MAVTDNRTRFRTESRELSHSLVVGLLCESHSLFPPLQDIALVEMGSKCFHIFEFLDTAERNLEPTRVDHL